MKYAFALAIIFFTYKIGLAQMEFAPIGAEWYYSQYESHNPPQANYIKHVCFKDSIIAGKEVKVIKKTLYRRNESVNMGFEYLHQNGDSVFYWKKDAFHILYNFYLSKGDSILLYSEMPDYCEKKSPYGWCSIDSVYTKIINDRSFKAYFSVNKKGYNWTFNGFPIIEKIGSTFYLLPQNTDCVMDIPAYGPLRCYSDPELGTCYFENFPCDTITTFPDGIKTRGKNPKVKIYPNPVHDDLYIEFDNGQLGSADFRLFDTNGKLVIVQPFRSKDKIDISCLKQGVYFISIYNNSKLFYDGIIFKN